MAAETKIVGYIDLDKAETKEAPLWWHKAGLQPTASGYGRKLATARMVKVAGRWRRIYVCIFGNVGTAYVVKGNDWVVVR